MLTPFLMNLICQLYHICKFYKCVDLFLDIDIDISVEIFMLLRNPVHKHGISYD